MKLSIKEDHFIFLMHAIIFFDFPSKNKILHIQHPKGHKTKKILTKRTFMLIIRKRHFKFLGHNEEKVPGELDPHRDIFRSKETM